jgi:3-oxoacyl-[acyl-carrier protein] reductase
VDITDSHQVQKFFDQVQQITGPPDVLVNCAGIWPSARAWEMSDDHWRRTIAVNLDGTYYTCRQACLRMIPRRRGAIVNLSSVSATRGARSGHADYSAAKGGVESLTKSLANELGPYGITVNAVAPGMIRTDMTSEALSAREREYLTQIPLGRIGTPEDVAAAVLFLASPAARYITGQILHVNGGLLMP